MRFFVAITLNFLSVHPLTAASWCCQWDSFLPYSASSSMFLLNKASQFYWYRYCYVQYSLLVPVRYVHGAGVKVQYSSAPHDKLLQTGNIPT